MKTSGTTICLLLTLLFYTSCYRPAESIFEPGVSSELAELRKEIISDLQYDLIFNIPGNKNDSITGNIFVRFNLSTKSNPLLLDFRSEEESILNVISNGQITDWKFINEHILIPSKDLEIGHNVVEIGFIAGDMSLNRNEEYLYSLFVPDRACTAFPCFDQPDLKASYKLILDIDSSWTAISNNMIMLDSLSYDRRFLEFSPTQPISSYLFAFAAGIFNEVKKEIGGREITMLHRETREELVRNNVDEIFQIHSDALQWLENYTDINYPFDKFGFILIPSFQYGGMEHPGSIYYRASSLLLEKDASLNRKLGRAGLIAHETSHIWFGDLVTMSWFDDVWLKEVFAGFMSDKIVNPGFPDENHELKFLLGRYPAAYAVDRTRGANPVIQNLDNMKNAGTLYGGIIYNKAPIVMKHLEILTGEDKLQEGLKEYLRRYSYSNAEWQDLVNILDELVSRDLKSWSDIWVRESQMPTIHSSITSDSSIQVLTIAEIDPEGKMRHWPQNLNLLLIENDTSYNLKKELTDSPLRIDIPSKVKSVIPNSDGIAYGYFKYDEHMLTWLGANIAYLDQPVVRGACWLNIWENMINGVIEPATVFHWIANEIKEESELQLQAKLRGFLSSLFWDYFTPSERNRFASEIESVLYDLYNEQSDPSQKKSYFNTYVNISTSNGSLDFLYKVWGGLEQPGLTLSETDKTSLAQNLALKGHPLGEEILTSQLESIENRDRKERMKFIIPSLSQNQEIRDNFFNSLLDESNREHEPWVTQALGYLNHPLRDSSALKYIGPGLEELVEIQETGDIFFPGQWISVILGGHRSREAYQEVVRFLDNNPDYPASLRLKILQASDHLFRFYDNP